VCVLNTRILFVCFLMCVFAYVTKHRSQGMPHIFHYILSSIIIYLKNNNIIISVPICSFRGRHILVLVHIHLCVCESASEYQKKVLIIKNYSKIIIQSYQYQAVLEADIFLFWYIVICACASLLLNTKKRC